MAKNSKKAECPCGGGDLAGCCGRFIAQSDLPRTALELMRSRYTAYVLRDERYLDATWYPRSRPEGRILADDDDVKWVGLEIIRHAQTGDEATVEFVARYKTGGRAQRLHEVSRFVHEGGRWFYVDGTFPGR